MLSTIFPLNEKLLKALRKMLTMIITLPARRTKPFRRCQVWIIRLLTCGTWYTGSSMTNGVASPRMMVYLSIRPVSTAITIPSIYSEKTARAPFCPKKAAANTAKIARRAPQDINGAIMMVIRRSRGASSVRAPITDGTLQPKPTISGTKDFPGKPSACIRRSITNAARAI
ncbi:Uncharacterised protein [Shigella flexneri]|nr:Uncharacterised protein [Shigella flexneri]